MFVLNSAPKARFSFLPMGRRGIRLPGNGRSDLVAGMDAPLGRNDLPLQVEAVVHDDPAAECVELLVRELYG